MEADPYLRFRTLAVAGLPMLVQLEDRERWPKVTPAVSANQNSFFFGREAGKCEQSSFP